MKTAVEYVYPQEVPTLMGTNAQPVATGGLTLRDWFAGQALAGALSSLAHPEAESPGLMDEKTIADDCYRYADAMLAARESKSPLTKFP